MFEGQLPVEEGRVAGLRWTQGIRIKFKQPCTTYKAMLWPLLTIPDSYPPFPIWSLWGHKESDKTE